MGPWPKSLRLSAVFFSLCFALSALISISASFADEERKVSCTHHQAQMPGYAAKDYQAYLTNAAKVCIKHVEYLDKSVKEMNKLRDETNKEQKTVSENATRAAHNNQQLLEAAKTSLRSAVQNHERLASEAKEHKDKVKEEQSKSKEAREKMREADFKMSSELTNMKSEVTRAKSRLPSWKRAFEAGEKQLQPKIEQAEKFIRETEPKIADLEKGRELLEKAVTENETVQKASDKLKGRFEGLETDNKAHGKVAKTMLSELEGVKMDSDTAPSQAMADKQSGVSGEGEKPKAGTKEAKVDGEVKPDEKAEAKPKGEVVADPKEETVKQALHSSKKDNADDLLDDGLEGEAKKAAKGLTAEEKAKIDAPARAQDKVVATEEILTEKQKEALRADRAKYATDEDFAKRTREVNDEVASYKDKIKGASSLQEAKDLVEERNKRVAEIAKEEPAVAHAVFTEGGVKMRVTDQDVVRSSYRTDPDAPLEGGMRAQGLRRTLDNIDKAPAWTNETATYQRYQYDDGTAAFKKNSENPSFAADTQKSFDQRIQRIDGQVAEVKEQASAVTVLQQDDARLAQAGIRPATGFDTTKGEFSQLVGGDGKAAALTTAEVTKSAEAREAIHEGVKINTEAKESAELLLSPTAVPVVALAQEKVNNAQAASDTFGPNATTQEELVNAKSERNMAVAMAVPAVGMAAVPGGSALMEGGRLLSTASRDMGQAGFRAMEGGGGTFLRESATVSHSSTIMDTTHVAEHADYSVAESYAHPQANQVASEGSVTPTHSYEPAPEVAAARETPVHQPEAPHAQAVEQGPVAHEPETSHSVTRPAEPSPTHVAEEAPTQARPSTHTDLLEAHAEMREPEPLAQSTPERAPAQEYGPQESPHAAPVREAETTAPHAAEEEVAKLAPAAAPKIPSFAPPSSGSHAASAPAHSAPQATSHASAVNPAPSVTSSEKVAQSVSAPPAISYEASVKIPTGPPAAAEAVKPAPVAAPVAHHTPAPVHTPTQAAPVISKPAPVSAAKADAPVESMSASSKAAPLSASKSAAAPSKELTASELAALNKEHPTSVEMPASKAGPIGHSQPNFESASLKSKYESLAKEEAPALHAETSAAKPESSSVAKGESAAEAKPLHENKGDISDLDLPPYQPEHLKLDGEALAAAELKADQQAAKSLEKTGGKQADEAATKPAGAQPPKKGSLLEKVLGKAKENAAEHEAALVEKGWNKTTKYWEPPKYDPEKAVLKPKNPEAKATHTNLRSSDNVKNLRRELDYSAEVRGLDPASKVRKYEEWISERFGMRIEDTVALSRNFHTDLTTDLSMGIVANKKGVAEISKAPTGMPRAFIWGEKNLEHGRLTPGFVQELHRRGATIKVVDDPKAKMLRVQPRAKGLSRTKESSTIKTGHVDPEVIERAKAYGIKVENKSDGSAIIRYSREPTEADLVTATNRINEVWNSGKYSPEYVAAYAHQELGILHGFDGGNGRTGRLVSQLIYKDATGEAAIFPKAFQREMEMSPRAMEREFLAAQERADASAAKNISELEQRQSGVHLNPDKTGEISGVKAPLAREANKPLPETLMLNDPKAVKAGHDPIAVKTADLPPTTTHSPGNVFYGRPAKDVNELDHNLRSLFSFGRQNRDGVTNNIFDHLKSTKDQSVKSGYFSTSKQFTAASAFSARPDRPFGFVAVIDTKGAPGLNINALDREFKGVPQGKFLDMYAEEKEFAMTGVDTRQIRGAWVNRELPAGGQPREMEWVANPNYDPNWRYQSAAEKTQIAAEAKQATEAKQGLVPQAVAESKAESGASRTPASREAPAVAEEAPRPWKEEAPKVKPTQHAETYGKVLDNFEAPAAKSTAAGAEKQAQHLAEKHGTFKEITAADNAHFSQQATLANAGEKSEIKMAASMQAAIGKQANDVMIKDKDVVNQVFNLQKSLVWDKIASDPLLKDRIVAKYSDFNTVRVGFDSGDKAVKERVTQIFEEYNKRYATYMDKQATAKGWDKKAMGLAEKRENWHHLGIGSTPDEANLAARKSREIFDENGIAHPRAYDDPKVQEAIQGDLKDIEKTRTSLESKFGETKGVMVGDKGEKVLSAAASETIRKAEQTPAAIKKALERQFDTKFTNEEVEAMRRYVDKADSFSPDLYVAERTEIPMDYRRNGVISVDLKGQNARNLEETMKSMVATREGHSVEDQIRAIRKGEQNATEVLDAKRARIQAAADKHLPGSKVFNSGDDVIIHGERAFTDEEFKAFAKDLGRNPDEFRLTRSRSYYGDNGAAIPKDGLKGESTLSSYVIDAEKVEKDLRKGLVNKFGGEVTKDTQIVVDMVPRSDGTKSIGIFLGGEHTPEQMQKIQAWSQKTLRQQGNDLAYIKPLGERAKTTADLAQDALWASKMEPERIAKAEKVIGRPLSESEQRAVMKSHLVGEGTKGADGSAAKIGNYTKQQIAEKARILDQGGFTAAERRKLMEEGVTGSRAEIKAETGEALLPENQLKSAKPSSAGITIETDLASGNSKIGRAPAGAIEVKEAPTPALSTVAEKRTDWLKKGDIEAHGNSVKPEEAVAEYKRLDSLRDPKNMPARPGADYYEQQANYIRAQKNMLSSEANEKVFGGLDRALEKEFKLDEELKQTEKSLKGAKDRGVLISSPPLSEATKDAKAVAASSARMEPERIANAEKTLGRKLDEKQQRAVMDAHFVGEGKNTIGNYTKPQIAEKARILEEAKFSVAERRRLMEAGIVGDEAKTSTASRLQQSLEKKLGSSTKPEVAAELSRIDNILARDLEKLPVEKQARMEKLLDDAKIGQSVSRTEKDGKPYMSPGIAGAYVHSPKNEPYLLFQSLAQGHPASRITARHELSHVARLDAGNVSAAEASRQVKEVLGRRLGLYREELQAWGDEWEFTRKIYSKDDLPRLREQYPPASPESLKFLEQHGVIQYEGNMRLFNEYSITNTPEMEQALGDYYRGQLNQAFVEQVEKAVSLPKSEYTKQNIRELGYGARQAAIVKQQKMAAVKVPVYWAAGGGTVLAAGYLYQQYFGSK